MKGGFPIIKCKGASFKVKKEIQELSGVSTNVVSRIINQLVELNVIVPDTTVMKKGFRYQKIYELYALLLFAVYSFSRFSNIIFFSFCAAILIGC